MVSIAFLTVKGDRDFIIEAGFDAVGFRVGLHLQTVTCDYYSINGTLGKESCRKSSIVTAQKEQFEKRAVEKMTYLQRKKSILKKEL